MTVMEKDIYVMVDVLILWLFKEVIMFDIKEYLIDHTNDNKYIIELFTERLDRYLKNCLTENTSKTQLVNEVVRNIDIDNLSKDFICDVECDFLRNRTYEQILNLVKEFTLIGLSKSALIYYIGALIDYENTGKNLYKARVIKVLDELWLNSDKDTIVNKANKLSVLFYWGCISPLDYEEK